jgi:hypothetical protein
LSTAATTPLTPKQDNARGALHDRVRSIRLRGLTDPIGARDEMWSWLNETSGRAPQERSRALDDLEHLWRAGEAWVADIDGHNVIGTPTMAIHPLADRTLAALIALWTPWHGKHWSAAERRGATTFSPAFRWAAAPIMPKYRFRRVGTRHVNGYFCPMPVQASVLDANHEVLVLDYASEPGQPWPMSLVHDEVTAVVPGAFLARIFLHVRRHGATRFMPIGYFPIKTALVSAGERPIRLPAEESEYPLEGEA